MFFDMKGSPFLCLPWLVKVNVKFCKIKAKSFNVLQNTICDHQLNAAWGFFKVLSLLENKKMKPTEWNGDNDMISFKDFPIVCLDDHFSISVLPKNLDHFFIGQNLHTFAFQIILPNFDHRLVTVQKALKEIIGEFLYLVM